MSEQPAAPAATSRPTTAGGLLRQARQAQGLHIAALATTIKVVPRKLEALEADQFDQLPDAAFTRALAQAVCRTLKIDAAPVLALLPPLNGGHRLEQVAEGLNTPFRERPGRLVPRDWASVATPALWLAGLIIILTLAVYVLPASWLPFAGSAMTRARPAQAASAAPADATATAASSAASAATVTAVVPTPTEAAPAPTADVSIASVTAPTPASASEAANVTGMLQVHAGTVPAWVGVIDAHGKALISRLLQPGENVAFDGATPLKVTIGNANSVRVTLRGEPFELAKVSRDNVARFEVK